MSREEVLGPAEQQEGGPAKEPKEEKPESFNCSLNHEIHGPEPTWPPLRLVLKLPSFIWVFKLLMT